MFAEVSGTLIQHGFLHGTATGRTRLFVAAVYVQLLFEIARLATWAEKVFQGGTALFDGGGQHLFDVADQLFGFRARQAVRGARRMQTAEKQGFVGVDVADATTTRWS